MKIKSTLLSFLPFLAILPPFTALLIFADSSFAAGQMIVKIGHVAPLTGPDAHLGRDNENGAKMAIDNLNAKGIMIGDKKVRFQLFTADDAGNPEQAAAVAKLLVNTNINGVVGHLNSRTSISAAPIYHAVGIPQISPSSTATAYTLTENNSRFRVVANDAQLGGILGRYAVQTLKANTIAVLADRTIYGQGVASEFIKGAKREAKSKEVKINLVQLHGANNQMTDFGEALTEIKKIKPDVIFFGGMDSAAASVLRQMKNLDIKTKFIGGDGICTTALPKLAGSAMASGQVTCAEAGGVVDTGDLDHFSKAYKTKFGINVVSYAPYAYDAVMTLVDAMQQAKSSQPAVYLPFLRHIHHKGITGDIAFDMNGNIQDATLTLFTYQSGKRQQIGILK